MRIDVSSYSAYIARTPYELVCISIYFAASDSVIKAENKRRSYVSYLHAVAGAGAIAAAAAAATRSLS